MKYDYQSLVFYYDCNISDDSAYDFILKLSADFNIPKLIVNLNAIEFNFRKYQNEIVLNIFLINNNETGIKNKYAFDNNIMRYDHTLVLILENDDQLIDNCIINFSNSFKNYRNILFFTNSGQLLTINSLGIIKTMNNLTELKISNKIGKTINLFPADDYRDINHTNLIAFYERKDPLTLFVPIDLANDRIVVSGTDGLMAETLFRHFRLKPKMYSSVWNYDNNFREWFSEKQPFLTNFYRRFYHPEVFTSNFLDKFNYR